MSTVEANNNANDDNKETDERDTWAETTQELIFQRINHTLQIYPRLSPSMLQIGIGTGLPPALWHPVLEAMERQGIVTRRQVRATNPVTKREQTYTIIESAADLKAA